MVVVRVVIDNRGVVDVRDRGGIDRRIADVDPIHILPADVVRGHINFPRTQRKPSHITAEANANANSSSSSTANKHHQRGRIYGLHRDGSGHPTPASADRDPASVMEWRVAPGRVIDPRISPGSNPVPVALVIRRPACFNTVGVPDVAVVRIVAPVAIVIQILIADDIVGQILRRARVVITVIAAVRPVIKLIGSADINYIGVQRVCPAESASLSGVQRVGLAVAGRFASALARMLTTV